MNAIKKWDLDGKVYYITVKKEPPQNLNGHLITIVYGSDKDGTIDVVSTYSKKSVYEEIAKMVQDSRERNPNLTPELRDLGFVEGEKVFTDEDRIMQIKKGIDYAISDYEERSNYKMFHTISLSPKNRDLFVGRFGKLYKGGFVLQNKRFDDTTVAIGGYGAILECSV